MCGIAGVYGYRESQDRLKAACDAIAHRGPDHQGIHVDGNIALVHTRLSVIDTSSAGDQPMIDLTSGVAIVFNGEIYNFLELREALGPVNFIGKSDTEVILRLYLRDGIACIEKLRGMFAIAIWDPRRDCLFLVRDRLGIKPIVYHEENGKFTFASESKALFALGVPQVLNLEAAHDYLETGRVVHNENSFFAGIKILPPGTIMVVDRNGISMSPFWSTQKFCDAAPPKGDIEASTWDLLLDVTRRHLISDVPVGISLSSGLDSQFLVHLLAAVGHRDIHAFTYGYDDQTYDEIVRLDSAKFPVHLQRHAKRLRPETMIADLERATRSYEVPVMGLGAMSGFSMMEMPRQKNVPVMMSGEGSDEAFCGYPHYFNFYCRDLYERADFEHLDEELSAFTKINGGKPITRGSQLFKDRILAANDELRAPDGTSLSGNAFLAGPLLDMASGSTPTIPVSKSHLRTIMLRDLQYQKMPKVLWFHDRNSMAWGVETRVPFLDHIFMEFAYSLPSEWLVRNGATKYLLKRLFQRFCGNNTHQVTKHSVAHPQREWLKYNLFNEINDYLDDGVLAQSGLIDYPNFKRAYTAYAETPELGNSFFVWKMLSMESLFRAFPDLKIAA